MNELNTYNIFSQIVLHLNRKFRLHTCANKNPHRLVIVIKYDPLKAHDLSRQDPLEIKIKHVQSKTKNYVSVVDTLNIGVIRTKILLVITYT